MNAPINRRCNFCDTDELTAEKLIAGPNVFICDQCLITSALIIIKQAPEYNFLGRLSEAMRINDELHRAAGTNQPEPSLGDKHG